MSKLGYCVPANWAYLFCLPVTLAKLVSTRQRNSSCARSIRNDLYHLCSKALTYACLVFCQIITLNGAQR